MKRALMVAMAVALLAPASAVAHDEECLTALWEAPIETFEPPEGWEVNGQSVFDTGWYIDLTGPERVDLHVECVADPDVYFEAKERSDVADGHRPLRVTPIGDRTRASRWGSADWSSTIYSYIDWTHGNVYGELEISEDADDDPIPWEDLEDIALAFDAILP